MRDARRTLCIHTADCRDGDPRHRRENGEMPPREESCPEDAHTYRFFGHDLLLILATTRAPFK